MKETSYSDRRFWCSYFLFIIIIGGILLLFIYITRLASKEIFSPSNKIHREVGLAKDLSAPLYLVGIQLSVYVHIINSMQWRPLRSDAETLWLWARVRWGQLVWEIKIIDGTHRCHLHCFILHQSCVADV